MRVGLQLKCDVTNLTDLLPSGQDFRWYVQERVALKDSRGDANLMIRCKFCNRVSSIDLLSETQVPYTSEDSGQFKTIVVFDCRGLELLRFSPRVGWTARGVNSGTLFNDVSLTDSNWCDYDDVGNCEVSIFNVESRFVKLK
ncbi:uncharacterized protein DEA37_0000882 [Paragonimus westermani]|uniref:Uncharacterized protein n=1 Tax=Paragonimus westermani TaxID=34504 RepID=A0A5J4NB30_9TREM|nr:uncharacterized protein DEA37_0000882 [Paragonimus westermani]